MRRVWGSGEGAQPFVVAGSGTLAMDMAVHNLLDPGQRALVVETGFFSERMALMLERRGVEVVRLSAEPGGVPLVTDIGDVDAVFVTHVDTSTGVRADVERIAAQVRGTRALLVVDGVCATGGEPLRMAELAVDVYLTASQKALGLPPGLALLVASARAIEARARLRVAPPLSLDWEAWRPIHEAYEAGRPSYFATPATPLVRGLAVGLREILESREGGLVGVEAAWARHARVGAALRRAWAAMGLRMLPHAGLEANTLSAIWLPDGADATLPARVAARGALVAGGLLPALRTRYFRVGHMGWTTTRPELLELVVRAVGGGLGEAGVVVDVEGAVGALG
jgi:alanine-glyoxylate transaminase/serine-glyoxylate transaminase/serine-pyruvate transaminase